MEKNKKANGLCLLAIVLIGIGCAIFFAGCTKEGNSPNRKRPAASSFPAMAPNGYVVYFNPETGQVCTEADYNANAQASDTGNKSGCMKWYVFNDDGGDTVNLLLDHNTTATVAWGSNPDTSDGQPDIVNSQLAADVAGWKSNVKATARLITANEVAQATGNIDFDSEKEEAEQIEFGETYWWLYDRMPTFEESMFISSYWTSSYSFVYNYDEAYMVPERDEDGDLIMDDSIIRYRDRHYTQAWIVHSDGRLGATSGVGEYEDYEHIGLRPVISVLRTTL